MEPAAETITGLLAAIRDREIRIPDLIDRCLSRIRKFDHQIGAFLHVLDEEAVTRAGRLQRRVERGDWPGPLTGIPIAIKDNLSVRGSPTSAGSRMLAGFRPLYTASCVARLEEAGAILIGKANLDEFAMGSSNEHSAFRAVRNPYDPARVPGGSSGGSAAAVAAGMALGALGTDTGGSVRQPAGFCGLVGLKPQYGSVSRYGLIAFGSSLEVVGPLGRTARDCALLQSVIRGRDPHDATSCEDLPAFDPDGLGAQTDRLRVGIPESWLGPGLAPEVQACFAGARERLRGLGVAIAPVALPPPDLAIAAYYVLANAEASSNLARYDGVRYGPRADGQEDLATLQARTRGSGFGTEVRRRILLGTFVLSAGYYEAYYRKATQVRAQIRAAYDQALATVDAILTPMSPTPPFPLGERLDDPLAMYLSDLFSVGANLTGYPAVAFPIGQTPDGLPIGGQLCGGAHSEQRLLGLVERFTEGRPFPRPSILAGDRDETIGGAS